MNTNELTKSAINYLSVRGALIWKHPTGTARSHDGKSVISFGKKGSADIIGMLACGKFAAVEIKAGKDTIKEDQREFANYCIKRDAFHVFCHTIVDLHNAYTEHSKNCEICLNTFQI